MTDSGRARDGAVRDFRFWPIADQRTHSARGQLLTQRRRHCSGTPAKLSPSYRCARPAR